MFKSFKSFGLVALAVAALVASSASAQYTESSSGCGSYSSVVGLPGTTLLGTVSGCDDCTQSVTLPFTFMLYGDQPFTTVAVTSNGGINLDNSTNSWCCSSFPVQLGGTITTPRIHVIQDDLYPGGRGNIYTRNTGSSFIVEYNDVSWFLDTSTSGNAQAELFPNGNVILRWGTATITDTFSAGVESDMHAPPFANPATGGTFGAGGVATSWPTNSCRLFSVAALPETNCVDGVDNDMDGAIDCADSDCLGDPACAGGGGDCDLTPVLALLNQVLARLDGIDNALDTLEAKGDRIEATVNALDAAFAALGAEIDALQAGQCELVRLLTTPQGRRTSECGGVTYSWNDNVGGD